ncbi:MAG: glycosyltransferase family 2 protein [Muribaculaceae bacterium]|nr:glycosyltransferase family 2 protein [Muribaculaceae bacterium]
MQELHHTRAVAGRPQHPVIALVVPCFNEEPMLPIAAPVLASVLDRMAAAGLASADSFVLFVDDGSSDGTWAFIKHAHGRDKRFKGIALAHNRGQQGALLAGLLTVREVCDAAITLDADLQDSPEAILEMVEKYKLGADIVYGVRASRASDTWFKRNSARAFYRMQRSMGLDTVYDHSEFRLMDRQALDLLSEYGESNLFIRGIMPHIGLRSEIVRYDRSPRTAGSTKYPLSKMLATSIDGITSFTARPMSIVFVVGLVLLLLDIAVGVWVLVSHFRGIAISGWSSLMLSVWFLGSLVLIALGIIGEYIGKIFIEVKHRPRYAIAERLLD